MVGKSNFTYHHVVVGDLHPASPTMQSVETDMVSDLPKFFDIPAG
jgi:hypothetical protein